MSVFSKLNKNPNMCFFGDIFPPFGLTSFIGAVVICFLGFYIFKKLGVDGNVSVRDSTKNHNWTPIKIYSKVRKLLQLYISLVVSIILGLELFYL